MNVNKVILIGRLGRDPELKHTQGGKAFCTFSIAVSEKWGEGEERTEWFDVAVFTKSAEACAKFLGKGSAVYVEGRLQSREWEKDGVKRRSFTVNAFDVKFLSQKKDNATTPAADPFGEPVNAKFPDDDLPF